MTEAAGLERGYRRLLAWYPRAFRSGHEEEMLAVLMAGARPGQRRPGLAEAVNVIKSALRMRFRPGPPGPENGAWADALAVFSLAAPLFLLAADILEVALPYRLPSTPMLGRLLGGHTEIGGLSLLSVHFFQIAVGCQVILAVLVLLGLRRVALIAIAGSVGYAIVARHWIPWIPHPLQLITTGVYLLEAAALTASPGPRRGRQLLTWSHGVVLLLAAGAVQASTLMYDATSPPARFAGPRSPDTLVYLVLSVVLAVAAAGLAVAVKINGYFLLLLAAMCYPYAMQLAFSPPSSSSGELLGHPTPTHLAVLYLPLLLLAGAAILTAVLPRRSRDLPSTAPEKPGLA